MLGRIQILFAALALILSTSIVFGSALECSGTLFETWDVDDQICVDCDGDSGCTPQQVMCSEGRAVCASDLSTVCSTECPSAICGDGVITPPEECDTKANPSGCGLNEVCDNCKCYSAGPVCGNKLWEPELGEVCDWSALQTGCKEGTCKKDCSACEVPAPVCGNGIVEPGEACDTADPKSCPLGFECAEGCLKCVASGPEFCGTLEVEALNHLVQCGTIPGSYKVPLVGISVCAYDKSEGSCAANIGVSHPNYEAIAKNCRAVNCAKTNELGIADIPLPAGDYIVISIDATKTVLESPLGVSASDFQCAVKETATLEASAEASSVPVCDSDPYAFETYNKANNVCVDCNGDTACTPVPVMCQEGTAVCDVNGNTVCAIECAAAVCGDGVITDPEVCDPKFYPNGGCKDGTVCSKDCLSCDLVGPVCGNGIWEPEFGEICDWSAANSGCKVGTCNKYCTACEGPVCGDGVITYPEVCDPKFYPNGGCKLNTFCAADCYSCEAMTYPVTMYKHLQQITKCDGKKVPGKTSKVQGSELLIIEPEYVLWDSTEELFPVLFESAENWDISAYLETPEGYVPDYEVLETATPGYKVVQFTVTEVGSVPDDVGVTLDLTDPHGNSIIYRSQIGTRLSENLANAKGVAINKNGVIIGKGKAVGHQTAPLGDWTSILFVMTIGVGVIALAAFERSRRIEKKVSKDKKASK